MYFISFLIAFLLVADLPSAQAATLSPKAPDTIEGYYAVTTTAGSTSISIASARFQQDDVGKLITIFGAGPMENRLTTSIARVDGPTSIQTEAPATQSMSGASQLVRYGGDQSASLQVIFGRAAASDQDCFVSAGTYLVKSPLTIAPNPNGNANAFASPSALCVFSPGAVIVAMAPMANLVTWGSLKPDYSGHLNGDTLQGGTFDGNFLAENCEYVPFFTNLTTRGQTRKNCLRHGVQYGDMTAPTASGGANEIANFHKRDIYLVKIAAFANGPNPVVTTAWDHGFHTDDVVSFPNLAGLATPAGIGWFSIKVTGPRTFTLNNANSTTWGAFAGGAVTRAMPGMALEHPIRSVATGAAATTITTDDTADLKSGQGYFIADLAMADAGRGDACVDGVFPVTIVNATTLTIPLNTLSCGPYRGGGRILRMNQQINRATVAAGGSGYGASRRGTIVGRGDGCAAHPELAVATNPAGAIVAVTSVIAAGDCATAPAAATSWSAVAGGGLDAGAGASFRLTPGPAVNAMESAIYNANATDFEGYGDQIYGVRIGLVANPASGGYDSKFQMHVYNYQGNGELLAGVYAGGDNSFNELQVDCPARFGLWLTGPRNRAVGSEMNCSGFAFLPDNEASYARLEAAAGLDLGFGSAKGQAGANMLGTLSSPNAPAGQRGGVRRFSQWAFRTNEYVTYPRPDAGN